MLLIATSLLEKGSSILSYIKNILILYTLNSCQLQSLQAVTSCNTMVFSTISFFSFPINSYVVKYPFASCSLNRWKNGIRVANRNAKRFAIK